jgi:nitronate monooxygenase
MLNFFVQGKPAPSEDRSRQGRRPAASGLESLGWQALPLPAKWCEDFEAQFETLLRLRPAAVSFTFGILEAVQVERLHGAGIRVIGTVTTVAEALAWQAIGADAVVASGIEAGGHRGTFSGASKTRPCPAGRTLAGSRRGRSDSGDCRRRHHDGSGHQAGPSTGRARRADGHCLPRDRRSRLHPAHTSAPALSGEGTHAADAQFFRTLRARHRERVHAADGKCRAARSAVSDAECADRQHPRRGSQKRRYGLMSMWCGTEFARARQMPARQLIELLASELQS